MNPTKADYEAIHKNSGYDLIDIGVAIKNGNISTDRVLDYITRRTDVAFRRGYWKACNRLKGM